MGSWDARSLKFWKFLLILAFIASILFFSAPFANDKNTVQNVYTAGSVILGISITLGLFTLLFRMINDYKYGKYFVIAFLVSVIVPSLFNLFGVLATHS